MMNTIEKIENPSVSHEDEQNVPAAVSPNGRKRLMVAGGLGLLAAALVVAAPELGIGGVIGGAVAGSGSAIATLFARR